MPRRYVRNGLISVVEFVDTEICSGEFFQSTCSPGSIVQIRDAAYGRMMLGRCVQTDFGYLGCVQNVTDILQRRCQGTDVCRISVPHEDLEDVNPCPTEVQAYLTVQYTCVPSKKLSSKY